MIYVVLLLSRPDCLPGKLEQYHQQSQHVFDEPMRLVVVESAKGIGACAQHPAAQHPDLNLLRTQAGAHSGLARNAGIELVRAEGGGLMCFWDDDDWYGPDFVHEAVHAKKSSGATIVGKYWHYVDYKKTHMFRFNAGLGAGFCNGVIGPTITVHSDDAEKFESRYLDDLLWCQSMRKKGARFWRTSMNNYVHCRHELNYTGNYSVEQLVYNHGDAEYLGVPNYRYATGEESPTVLRTVRPHERWEAA